MDRYTLPKRYHVVKKLGVGSTGSVYLVFDNLLKKEVALKIFDGSKPYQPNEFKLLSRLEHPNIVKVFDYFCGKEGEYTFFTQEYVEGLDIVSYSKNLNQEDKLHLVSELAIGISFLHDNNIIHQDLKPSNIFVTKKEGVKILDFGMAGLVEKDGLSGTPAYMAPELIEGSIPDQRSDLYALGVIIHEMIVGSNPFIGKNIADTLHRQKAFSPKIDGDKRISPVIAILLKKLLSKEPNLRLQGAEEVLYFLQKTGAKFIQGKLSEGENLKEPLINELIRMSNSAIIDGTKIVFAGFTTDHHIAAASRELSVSNQLLGSEVIRWNAQTYTSLVDSLLAMFNKERIEVADKWQLFEVVTNLIETELGSKRLIIIVENGSFLNDYTEFFLKYLIGKCLKSVFLVVLYKKGRDKFEFLQEMVSEYQGKVSSIESALSKSVEEKIAKIEEKFHPQGAAKFLIKSAEKAFKYYDYSSAIKYIERVMDHCKANNQQVDQRIRELYGDTLFKMGDYKKALHIFETFKEKRFENLIKEAKLKTLTGDFDGARRLFSVLKPTGKKEKDILEEGRIRALISEGKYKEIIDRKDWSNNPVIQNAVGLAHYYLGQYDKARDCFVENQRIAGGATQATSLNYLGMISYNQARYDKAKEYYSKALDIFQRLSNPSGRLSALMNLAAVCHVLGEYKNARELYSQALGVSKLINETSIQANLYNNLANLYVTMRGFEEAKVNLQEAKRIASKFKLAATSNYNDLIEADLYVATEDYEKAQGILKKAIEEFERLKLPRELCVSYVNHSKASANDKQSDEYLTKAEGFARKYGLEDQLDSILIARAHNECKSKKFTRESFLKLKGLLNNSGVKPKELLWESYYFAVLYSKELDHKDDLESLKKSYEIITWLSSQLPLEFRERYLREPTRIKVIEFYNSNLSEDDMQASNLKRLLEVNKRLTSELSTKKVLPFIMDSVVELTGAERGFLVLRTDKKDGISIPIARNVDAEDIKKPQFKISRSIAERVLRRGEGLLTTDALEDSRFKASESVHAMKLRSVMCVPMKYAGETMGAIYVDNRYQTGLFDEDDLELLSAFGDQAAVAYTNARLYEEKEDAFKKVEELNQKLESVVAKQMLEIETISNNLATKQKDLELKYQYKNIIGKSPAIKSVFQMLDRITDTDSNVLITGESGTGKELVAKAVHYNGARREKPFVSVNCAAIPSNLLESELFGHKKGAFTGAISDKVGLFEQANGGTIFLDEIGDMPLDMQAKLLRVIQDGEIRRVGSNQHVLVNVRVIAATNRDLQKLVIEKKFREDLFYRLNVLPIHLPALRERREDISLLIEHFLEKYSRGGQPKVADKNAMRLLMSYDWPGNVRELENEIERATVLTDGEISQEALSDKLKYGGTKIGYSNVSTEIGSGGMKEVRGNLERQLILEALEKTSNNKAKAAKVLGLSRYGLYKKMEKYGMS